MSAKPAATGTHTTAAIASGNVEESARAATADAAETARTQARKTRRMRRMRGSPRCRLGHAHREGLAPAGEPGRRGDEAAGEKGDGRHRRVGDECYEVRRHVRSLVQVLCGALCGREKCVPGAAGRLELGGELGERRREGRLVHAGGRVRRALRDEKSASRVLYVASTCDFPKRTWSGRRSRRLLRGGREERPRTHRHQRFCTFQRELVDNLPALRAKRCPVFQSVSCREERPEAPTWKTPACAPYNGSTGREEPRDHAPA